VTRTAAAGLIVALAATVGVLALVVSLDARAGSSARGRFEPQWLNALSAKEFWLGVNGAVLHTSDGGRHFGRLPAPPASGNVRFADSRNGFAYGWRTPLYTTHDGGTTWHRVGRRNMLALATANGTAYAVTGVCARDGSCRGARFERSPVSRDAWVPSPIPFRNAVPGFALAARGSAVWLFGGSSAGRYRLRNLLARSMDGGRTFATGSAPCFADLAAELEPVSSRVLWAFCPTGMLGTPFRSTNSGKSFATLSVPHCCPNGASLAPASTGVAVIAPNGAGAGIVRTTDGGATWRPAQAPINATYRITFVDSRVGLALVGFPRTTQLWKTTDAGLSWHRVPIR
jgi:photosystem II stability/assembly factor-like uncharacterized protein